MIRQRIEESRREATSVYITDGSGTIQLSYRNGHFNTYHEGRTITEMLPEIAHIFAAESSEQTHSDGETVYATRLRLGQETSESRADVGIVVQVAQ
jgi:hypothetical protein